MPLKKYRKVFRKRTLAKQVKTLAKVCRTLKPEIKPFDAGGLFGVSNTGVVTNVCIPSQGTTYINRVGLKILPKYLNFRAQVEMSSSATSSFLRLIFFRGIRETGATYGVTDILSGATMDSPLVWLARDRFKLISDHTYYFSDASSYGRMIVKNIKLNKPLEFTGNGTGVQNNGVYMLMLSNEPTNTIQVDWHTRTTFTDV